MLYTVYALYTQYIVTFLELGCPVGLTEPILIDFKFLNYKINCILSRQKQTKKHRRRNTDTNTEALYNNDRYT